MTNDVSVNIWGLAGIFIGLVGVVFAGIVAWMNYLQQQVDRLRNGK